MNTTIYERMLAESKKLDSQINYLHSKLEEFPDGKLICSHSQSRVKWYSSDGHTKHYIPKSNRALAEQLAAKKYLSLTLEELLSEKKAIDFYLRHHSDNTGKAEYLLTEIPGYHELLAPYFSPQSKELSLWMQEEYESNTKYPEQLRHKTSSGNLVRSKSEAMIDMFLYTNRIPFRYECGLELGNVTIYPDFTIRHPETGETYYWEHFGRMDDPSYTKSVPSKLQLYISNGIIPDVNLITTYETMECPLSSEWIETIITHYFH